MKRLIVVLAIFTVLLGAGQITVLVSKLRANDAEQQFRDEQKIAQEQAELEKHCKLAFLKSPANQLRCLDKTF